MEYVRFGATIRPEQKKALDTISNRTGVPVSYMVREAIDDYLEKTGEVVTKEE